MATTTNYGWAYPTVGADADTWGATLNTTVQAIDTAVFAALLKDGSRTMTGKLSLMAGTTSAASLSIPAGSAPTTPANGDFWATSSALFGRLGGATKEFAFKDSDITGNAATATKWATARTFSYTGDVTGSLTTVDGSADETGALTIANDAVTNAKMADVATATFKGRATAGTGDPEDLTVAQAVGLLAATDTEARTGTSTTDLVTPANLSALVYESAELSVPTSGGAVTAQSHGLGAAPKWTQAVLRCKTTDQGYSAGDEVNCPFWAEGGSEIGILVYANSTQIGAVRGQDFLRLPNKGDGTAVSNITTANWRLVLRCGLI